MQKHISINSQWGEPVMEDESVMKEESVMQEREPVK
jgi:hypothetical protein